MISINDKWFLAQVPGLLERLDSLARCHYRSELMVVSGPNPARGGTTPDPYVGLTEKSNSNSSFAIAAGFKNSASTSSTDCFGRFVDFPRDRVFVGLRAFPEFGGRGRMQVRGTLMDGCNWANNASESFRQQRTELQNYSGPYFQYALWRSVELVDDPHAYLDEVVEEMRHLCLIVFGKSEQRCEEGCTICE